MPAHVDADTVRVQCLIVEWTLSDLLVGEWRQALLILIRVIDLLLQVRIRCILDSASISLSIVVRDLVGQVIESIEAGSAGLHSALY